MPTDPRAEVEALPEHGFAKNRPLGARTMDGHALTTTLRRRLGNDTDWDAWLRSVEDQAAILARPAPPSGGEWTGWVYSKCLIKGHPPEGHWHPPVGAAPFSRLARPSEGLREALAAMPVHFAIGVPDGHGSYDDDDQQCATCAEDWPCPTSTLLAALTPADPSAE